MGVDLAWDFGYIPSPRIIKSSEGGAGVDNIFDVISGLWQLILFILQIAALVVAVVSLWLTTRKMRGEFRKRYNRRPTDHELTSITAWMADTPDEKKAREGHP
jgi:hypothetical protein